MKIQVLFTSAYPVGNAGTNRVHFLCKGLVESGADVELLITNPTEACGNVKNTNPIGIYENVHFHYIRNKLKRSKNIAIRKITDAYCHFMAILQVFFNRDDFDSFIIIGTLLDFRIFLPLIMKIGHRKILLEINEYPYATKKNTLVTRIKRFVLFRYIFPLYDGFIVISTSLDNLVCQYKSPRAISIVLPILGNYSYVENTCQPPIRVPYIIHAGSLVENKDGIIGILQAFKNAIDSLEGQIKLVITGNAGDSKEYARIVDFIYRHQLSGYIVFTGFLTKKELDCYLAHSSLAIINKYNNIQNRFCFPTKLIDYLKHKVPLIVTEVGESITYLKDGMNAYIVEPGNSSQLTAKIIQVIKNPEQAKTIAENGSSLVKQEFNYTYQGQRLLEYLNSVMGFSS
jgi:glycosyltransferase involved in cell wall biosynthesis